MLEASSEEKSTSWDCASIQHSCSQLSVIENLHIKKVTHSLTAIQVEAVVYAFMRREKSGENSVQT